MSGAGPAASPEREGGGGAGGAGGAAGTDIRLVLVTAPDEDVAQRLVETLVAEEVVACGNILPGVRSIYRWQGALERAGEVLVLLKTTSPGVARLLERVPALHPYEVPEVLVLAVEAGHAAYLQWVRESVRTVRERD